jgi:hypothetical protein
MSLRPHGAGGAKLRRRAAVLMAGSVFDFINTYVL